MLPHAHPIEYLFVVVASMGLWLSIRRFHRAMLVLALTDLHQVAAISPDCPEIGPAEIRAAVTTDVRREFFLGLVHVTILVTAVAFLFMAPPPPAYDEVPQSRFGMLMWIIVSLILTFKSLITGWSQRQEELLYSQNRAKMGRRSTDQRG